MDCRIKSGNDEVFVTFPLTAVANTVTLDKSRSSRDAFREGTFGMRERVRCLRADGCDPRPGGFGSPLDRHYDRSPRSAVDL